MKYIRNTMQRPGQWTVIWVKNHREHFMGTYATEADAQQAAWPNYKPVASFVTTEQQAALNFAILH